MNGCRGVDATVRVTWLWSCRGGPGEGHWPRRLLRAAAQECKTKLCVGTLAERGRQPAPAAA